MSATRDSPVVVSDESTLKARMQRGTSVHDGLQLPHQSENSISARQSNLLKLPRFVISSSFLLDILLRKGYYLLH